MTCMLSAMSGPLGAVLLNVLIQLCIIISAARVFSWIAQKCNQPAVVGEITAGLLLGPSFFGAIWPDAFHAVFDPATDSIFKILSQIGLIFLLFLIGLEFDFRHVRRDARGAIGVSLAGILLPFALGCGLAYLMSIHLGADQLDPWSAPHAATQPAQHGGLLLLGLFMGTAMSITAIPVLGRIMMELNLTRGKIGAMTITAAAFGDAVGWILLAAVSSLATTRFDGGATLKMVGWSVVFAAGMVWIVRPMVSRWWLWVIRAGRQEPQSQGLIEGEEKASAHTAGLAVKTVGYDAVAVVIVVLLLCAICTHVIGISAIFGAFMFGAVMSATPSFHEAMRDKLMMFVTVFFLPIFFTYTGLRTDVGTLTGPAMWAFAGLVLLFAIAGKFGGCLAAARLAGFSAREAACVGVMMNTRGLMELVVATVGLELRIIPPSVFCMLVIMAVATTVMTTPLVLWLSKGTELEAMIAESEWVRRRAGR